MRLPTFKEFKKRTSEGNLIPLCVEIPADLDTPVSAFLKIRKETNNFLLESVQGGEKWGRYSFMGTNPFATLELKNHKIYFQSGKKKEIITAQTDPFAALRELLAQFIPAPHPHLPRFTGGAVGMVSYDAIRYLEKIPEKTKKNSLFSDAYWMIAHELLVYDNQDQTLKIIVNVPVDTQQSIKKSYLSGARNLEKLLQRVYKPLPSFKKRKMSSPSLKALTKESEFIELVKKIQEYIRAGDVFQTVLSVPFIAKGKINALDLYRSLRRTNPSPYLYLLDLPYGSLVGASPEVMSRVTDRTVELRPIAGTRRRGRTEEEDAHLEAELRADPKERAEHVMLVDLGRNDLGRVCEAGSVSVKEMEVVERYAHVMHLVSHVSGHLKEKLDAFDVMAATFPAGTLTGAPKIRAMEIIEELEKTRRGYYGGCVGYVGFNGNMDTAITIRSAFVTPDSIHMRAGAGIVLNSVPELEYKECQNKAATVVHALEGMKK